jgi:glycosyltransferase involved in cell wall biosynthesis
MKSNDGGTFTKISNQNLLLMKSDLITVVVPAFNRGKLIARALKSIANQTYTNFKCIVVDDCSVDDTELVIREFIRLSKNGEKFEYHKLPNNSGACVARNVGIELANSEWISFLDSDDEWCPDMLGDQLECLNKNPRARCSYSRIGILNNGHLIDAPTPYGVNGYILKEALHQLYICTPTTLIAETNLVKKIGGFDPAFTKGCNDDDFCIRLAMESEFAFVDRILAIFHDDGQFRISHHATGQIDGRMLLLRKYRDFIIQHCGIERLESHYWDTYNLLRSKFLTLRV